MFDMLQLVVPLDKNQPQMDEVMSGGVSGYTGTPKWGEQAGKGAAKKLDASQL